MTIIKGPGQRQVSAGSRLAWHLHIDGSTDTAALTQPAIATSLPSSALVVDDSQIARIRFGGTAAADLTINYQVVLWSRFEASGGSGGTVYLPVVVASGVATLGALTYGAGTDIGAAANLMADTITETMGLRGSLVTSAGGDGIAELEVDLRNAAAIEVQTDLGTAASADVLVQLGELASGGSAGAEPSVPVVTYQGSVALTQAAAGRTTIQALEAGKVIRLHALLLIADAAGDVYLAYDDDGAGTNEVKLTGVMPLAANGGFRITAGVTDSLQAPAGKQLTLVTTTSKVFGYAVVSKAVS